MGTLNDLARPVTRAQLRFVVRVFLDEGNFTGLRFRFLRKLLDAPSELAPHKRDEETKGQSLLNGGEFFAAYDVGRRGRREMRRRPGSDFRPLLEMCSAKEPFFWDADFHVFVFCVCLSECETKFIGFNSGHRKLPPVLPSSRNRRD
jgi:hypothetical protein